MGAMGCWVQKPVYVVYSAELLQVRMSLFHMTLNTLDPLRLRVRIKSHFVSICCDVLQPMKAIESVPFLQLFGYLHDYHCICPWLLWLESKIVWGSWKVEDTVSPLDVSFEAVLPTENVWYCR